MYAVMVNEPLMPKKEAPPKRDTMGGALALSGPYAQVVERIAECGRYRATLANLSPPQVANRGSTTRKPRRSRDGASRRNWYRDMRANSARRPCRRPLICGFHHQCIQSVGYAGLLHVAFTRQGARTTFAWLLM